MDTDAKAVWRRLVPQLDALRVLTRIDRLALARYCVLSSQWKRATMFIAEHGESYVTEGRDGTKLQRRRPESAIVERLASLLIRLGQEFGMTSASWTRMTVEWDDSFDEIDALLNPNGA